MDLPVMVLILLLLGATWLFIRRRQTPKDDDQQDITRSSGPGTEYHAVSIKLSGNACGAAREMEGRRFLSSAAPKLPLAECDVLECKCRFVHHQDRRIAKTAGCRSDHQDSAPTRATMKRNIASATIDARTKTRTFFRVLAMS